MKAAFLAVLASCVAMNAKAGSPAEDLDTLNALAFGAVKSATVAKLDGGSKSRQAFHGYKVVGKWLELEEFAGRKLGELLRGRIDEEIASFRRAKEGETLVQLTPFCFEPGYAVRLETDRGVRDFVICLKCQYFYVCNDQKLSVGINPGPEMLTKLKAAYLDEFILNEGLKPKH